MNYPNVNIIYFQIPINRQSKYIFITFYKLNNFLNIKHREAQRHKDKFIFQPATYNLQLSIKP